MCVRKKKETNEECDKKVPKIYFNFFIYIYYVSYIRINPIYYIYKKIYTRASESKNAII